MILEQHHPRSLPARRVFASLLGLVLALRVMVPMPAVPGVIAICAGTEIVYVSLPGAESPADAPERVQCPAFQLASAPPPAPPATGPGERLPAGAPDWRETDRRAVIVAPVQDARPRAPPVA